MFVTWLKYMYYDSVICGDSFILVVDNGFTWSLTRIHSARDSQQLDSFTCDVTHVHVPWLVQIGWRIYFYFEQWYQVIGPLIHLARVYIYMNIHLYICIYIWMYTHKYMYIYIHIIILTMVLVSSDRVPHPLGSGIYIYIYIYIYRYIYKYTYIDIDINIDMDIYTDIDIDINIWYRYIYIYIYIYIYMYNYFDNGTGIKWSGPSSTWPGIHST